MVTISIKKDGAVIITFQINTTKFRSLSERSKFFEELYGRRQVIRREEKKYEYYRKGVLDTMGHLRVDNSVFIIMRENMKRMEQFFDEWENKVIFKTFPVLLTKEQFLKMKNPEKDTETEGQA